MNLTGRSSGAFSPTLTTPNHASSQKFSGFGEGAPLDLADLSEPATAALMGRFRDRSMNAFLDAAASVHYCSRPIRLAGGSQTVDTRTGAVLSTYTSTSAPLGVTLLPCGNRRASVCPACSRTYARDTFELIRAGAVGGKTVPISVAYNPMLFVTLTAPSFGHVHRTVKPGQSPILCRPRGNRDGVVSRCEHGRPVGCMAVHEPGDPRSGQPICPDCYDYDGHVIWQWWAPELWRRFIIDLRRGLARALDVPEPRLKDHATVQYAKVAEYQTRGVVHFHALIRLDGPKASESGDAAGGGFGPAPRSVPVQMLAHLVETAAAGVRYDAPPVTADGLVRKLRFGGQLDVKVIRGANRPDTSSLDDAGHGLQSEHVERVAGYLAKYSTKSAADAAPDGTTSTPGTTASKNVHLAQLRRTCFRTAELAREQTQVSLGWGGGEDHPYRLVGKWAHMLGFRGHFSTKSRRYSITLGRLRRARRRWQTITADAARAGVSVDVADLEARLMAEDDDETTFVVGDWTYIGTGWASSGDAALANAAAARAREYDRWKSGSRANSRSQ